MKIFTIGFTKKRAEEFFTKLQTNRVESVLDVRRSNSSQLSGFAKKEDLAFFLKDFCQINYHHILELAPSNELLDAYRKKLIGWENYEAEFLRTLSQLNIEEKFDKRLFSNCCLLCSEASPHHCHRRLVAEYLRSKWADVEIEHL